MELLRSAGATGRKLGDAQGGGGDPSGRPRAGRGQGVLDGARGKGSGESGGQAVRALQEAQPGKV